MLKRYKDFINGAITEEFVDKELDEDVLEYYLELIDTDASKDEAIEKVAQDFGISKEAVSIIVDEAGLTESVEAEEETHTPEETNKQTYVERIGNVNVVTGDGDDINVFEQWDGSDMVVEVWKKKDDDAEEPILVATSGGVPVGKQGQTVEFVTFDDLVSMGFWTFVESVGLDKLPTLADKYDENMAVYVYK